MQQYQQSTAIYQAWYTRELIHLQQQNNSQLLPSSAPQSGNKLLQQQQHNADAHQQQSPTATVIVPIIGIPIKPKSSSTINNTLVSEGEAICKSKPSASTAAKPQTLVSEGESKPCLVCEGEVTKQHANVSNANKGALTATKAANFSIQIQYPNRGTTIPAINYHHVPTESATKQFTPVSVPIVAAVVIVLYIISTTPLKDWRIIGSILATVTQRWYTLAAATDLISCYIHRGKLCQRIHYGKHIQHKHQRSCNNKHTTT